MLNAIFYAYLDCYSLNNYYSIAQSETSGQN